LKMRRLSAGVLLLIASAIHAVAQQHPPEPAYIGSAACSTCHEEASAAWQGSMHELAWQEPTETSVLGDFNDAVFEHRGVVTRFTREGAGFAIETEGSDGVTHRFSVVGVAGIAPLQQYLLETQPGRLQSFDVAWDVGARRWYHLYPEANLPPGDGLHWTGPYKNWNARCAECHATGFEKNYDPATRSYHSTEAEIRRSRAPKRAGGVPYHSVSRSAAHCAVWSRWHRLQALGLPLRTLLAMSGMSTVWLRMVLSSP